jgi:hypothetical protein
VGAEWSQVPLRPQENTYFGASEVFPSIGEIDTL